MRRKPRNALSKVTGPESTDCARGRLSDDEYFLLYDYLQVAGGAERFSLVLASVARNFRMVVTRVHPDVIPLLALSNALPKALGSRSTRWLGRVPEAIYCFLARTGFLKRARVVVYSGFYAPLAVWRQHEGKRVYYCHTIPRYAYDLHEYTSSSFPAPLRPLFRLFCFILRWGYERALRRMDVLISNSENIRNRLRLYTGLESMVIHPPIQTNRFRWIADGDYYLSNARLEPLKRVELIVRAFASMPKRKLVIASGGSQAAWLQQIAKTAPNITFTGWLEEEEWARLLGRARAAVYVAIDEDFGMSPVEAMAAGKPVIAVAEGGLTETVVHRLTGLLIEGTVSAEKVRDAVEELERIGPSSMRAACEQRAQSFEERQFASKMLRVLQASN